VSSSVSSSWALDVVIGREDVVVTGWRGKRDNNSSIIFLTSPKEYLIVVVVTKGGVADEETSKGTLVVEDLGVISSYSGPSVVTGVASVDVLKRMRLDGEG
jgi:hypothetical protein